MNLIAEEMRAILEGSEETELKHYGMPRRSGRYPWGSGDDPYQRTGDFLSRVRELKKQGLKESEIAEKLGILNHDGKPSSGKLRTEIAWASDERKMYQAMRAKSLKADGLNTSQIGRAMGVNESTVRGWLEPEYEKNAREAYDTAQFIKKQIKKKGMIEVGLGVERELKISPEKLKTAIHILEKDGYPVYNRRVEQASNTGRQTTQPIICRPGTPYKAIYEDLTKIHALNEDKYFSPDEGHTFKQLAYPKSMDPNRLKIRYVDEAGPDGITGGEKDGLVELRRGVADLDLQGSRYAQVRILVDNDRYIKGMATYSDNLPDGVDVVFNTNKKSSVPMRDVLKPIKDDPDNPFGSLIKDIDHGGQYYYKDKDGNEQLGLINKRSDQGDWSEWADTLPSQFLSKQPLALINKQLDAAKADKRAEYDSICEITNPTIKKHLLSKFADECDSAAVDLKAAALPGQKYHVMIPINTLKDDEIYAPQYEDGTKLALVRYPHAGLFEIPILTVNNKNELGRRVVGHDSIDGIGINKKNADQLSGADFDGDTVMCIPTHGKTGIKIQNQKPYDELVNFDAKIEYAERPGMRYMKYTDSNGKVVDNTQKQMGEISNLITDMTLGGAKEDEIIRAVKHSMVVIDAAKHKLDYKRSEAENNIKALKKKWQISVDENGEVKYGGASTIISAAKGDHNVDKRQGSPRINIKGKSWYDPSKPEGSLIYKTADDLYYPDQRTVTLNGKKYREVRTTDGKKVRYDLSNPDEVERYQPIQKKADDGTVSYTNKDGSITYRYKTRTDVSTNMAEADDARTLISKLNHPKERAYADYANSMKALANEARKTMMYTQEIKKDPAAAKTYAAEVASLEAKLNQALLNAPRERAAQRKAMATANAKQAANPNMSKGELGKERQRALTAARKTYNAISRKDRNIEITDREWEAIQAGAISKTDLTKILNNTDVAVLRQRATPKTNGTQLSTTKVNRIKSLAASGKTLQQIADQLNVSPSTVDKYLRGGND